MQGANERQVGGDHYKGGYEHWDFALDAGLGYLLGCATKYVSRWRQKNGVQDLEKALHYLQKAVEVGQPAPKISQSLEPLFKFCSGLHPKDSVAIASIVFGEYVEASGLILRLIVDAESESSTPE